ncbi:MAG: LysE family translocator [Actinomycetes bacterium]
MTLIIPSRLWEYLIAATLIILAPGPSVLFTIARAISWGRATAVATVLGNALGMFTISILVAVGLGPVLQRYHSVYIGVQWVGALYLVYLGIDAIRHSKEHAQSMTDLSGGKPSLMKTIRQGYLVGVLNPKSMVFFAAILPQFTDHEKGHLTSQLLLLGAIFCIICFFSDGTWGIVAGTIRNWLSSDARRLERLRAGGGIVMVGLGIITFVNSLLNR